MNESAASRMRERPAARDGFFGLGHVLDPTKDVERALVSSKCCDSTRSAAHAWMRAARSAIINGDGPARSSPGHGKTRSRVVGEGSH